MVVAYLKSYFKALFKAPVDTIIFQRVYGTYHSRFKDYGATIHVRCPKCSHEGVWHLVMQSHWFIFLLIPLIPYKRDYYLRCEDCEEKISLPQSEITLTKKLSKAMSNAISGQAQSLTSDQITLQQTLAKRITRSNGDHINTNEDSVWNILNDQFVDAIELSNYKPGDSIDTINKLLLENVNINAKNSDGRTLLAIAKYIEAPISVRSLIINFGGK